MWKLSNPRHQVLGYVRGTRAEARAAAGRLADRTQTGVLVNPQRTPVVGEIWRGIRGDRCRIVKVAGTQVTVLQLDTGHRVTSHLADFLATYKPPAVRSNPAPKRKGRFRNVREPGRLDPDKVDQGAARELELFIDNDGDLYRQQTIPILKNLWRKMQKGTYDFEKSVKLLGYLVESGGKKYAREFSASERDWTRIFNPDTREYVARVLADNMRIQLENREFDWQQVQPAKKGLPRKSGKYGKAIDAALDRMLEPPMTTREWATVASRADLKTANASDVAHGIVAARRSGHVTGNRRRKPNRRGRNPRGHDPALDEAVRRISAGLRGRSGKAWSVTRGRGSVYGWIYIKGPGGRDLTRDEQNELGLLLGLESVTGAATPVHHQGERIPSGSAARAEYVARAEGKYVGPPKRNPSRSKGARAGRKAKRAAYGSRRAYRAAVRTHHAADESRPGALKRFGHYHESHRTRLRRRLYRGPSIPNQRGRNSAPSVGSMWATRDYPRHVARVSSNERARGGMPPMVNLEITGSSGREIYGRSRIPLNEFWARYEPLGTPNPKRRKYGQAPSRAGARAERLTVREDYWIEPSTPAELAESPEWPYRMVTSGGQRYGLSASDAIRAQKEGRPFKPRPNRRRRGPKRNPRGGEIAGARAMAKRWHDSPLWKGRATRVSVPPRPKALAKLGELKAVVYESDKYAGTPDNPSGRKQLYEHKTKRPHPVLAADSRGHIHIVGGKMVPTADGLIN